MGMGIFSGGATRSGRHPKGWPFLVSFGLDVRVNEV